MTQNILIKLKTQMKKTKDSIKLEFSKSTNNLWTGEIKKVNYKESANFHPRLNKLFRRKNIFEVDHIIVKEQDKNIPESLNIETKDYVNSNSINDYVRRTSLIKYIFNNKRTSTGDCKLTTHKNAKIIEEKLQNLYNKIKSFYNNWGLTINASKCESILFRNILDKYSKQNQRSCKQFQLIDVENDEEIKIPHKPHVRYLGIILDERLRFNVHVNTQLSKATNTFKKLHNLFYSPYLCSRTKYYLTSS
ncbi:hypothetical protein TSAR_012602 [Trichomalopsis sarcophagae]|uniref:Reverse transcriptase domain-containing protein n=1 Tax=Trichomalopsis sarcophagae TaxID=543379 RepID=A0A232EQS6_9HYME|nr:hypothetical protein TSAR_012602 [Trichomalopsis sarcophagae]